MPEENPTVGRRALIGGGLASAVGIGIAACSTSSPQPNGSTGAGATTGASTGGAATSTPAATASPTGTSATGSPDAVPAILRTPGPDVRRGPSAVPAVALTFHGAGDPALTHRALQVLADHGAHVTVFAVGTWLSQHPELGRALVAAGHDLGNHTWSHQTMPRLSASAARTEVEKGAKAVAAIDGSSPYLFRPSGTPTSTPTIRAAARASGYARCISYDVDPSDYLDPGAAAVASRTLSAVQPGSIVSLHLGHPGTIDALPTILRGLASRSLQAVPMTKLMA
ncbi:polysaccharide deacetylase family protein [Terrabacter sp. NPDC080008]|uniref:polysaccharide deacetylase family protein n=1 Tax=Terrabacter sp. NPDC080008 TaxID=3155176 RepID=UPI003450B15F